MARPARTEAVCNDRVSVRRIRPKTSQRRARGRDPDNRCSTPAAARMSAGRPGGVAAERQKATTPPLQPKFASMMAENSCARAPSGVRDSQAARTALPFADKRAAMPVAGLPLLAALAPAPPHPGRRERQTHRFRAVRPRRYRRRQRHERAALFACGRLSPNSSGAALSRWSPGSPPKRNYFGRLADVNQRPKLADHCMS
jgi:hypothetical protein